LIAEFGFGFSLSMKNGGPGCRCHPYIFMLSNFTFSNLLIALVRFFAQNPNKQRSKLLFLPVFVLLHYQIIILSNLQCAN
jgi:hypothetical protein